LFVSFFLFGFFPKTWYNQGRQVAPREAPWRAAGDAVTVNKAVFVGRMSRFFASWGFAFWGWIGSVANDEHFCGINLCGRLGVRH
jgi:hypothetical protein